jgi:flagellar motor switch protein FliN
LNESEQEGRPSVSRRTQGAAANLPVKWSRSPQNLPKLIVSSDGIRGNPCVGTTDNHRIAVDMDFLGHFSQCDAVDVIAVDGKLGGRSAVGRMSSMQSARGLSARREVPLIQIVVLGTTSRPAGHSRRLPSRLRTSPGMSRHPIAHRIDERPEAATGRLAAALDHTLLIDEELAALFDQRREAAPVRPDDFGQHRGTTTLQADDFDQHRGTATFRPDDFGQHRSALTVRGDECDLHGSAAAVRAEATAGNAAGSPVVIPVRLADLPWPGEPGELGERTPEAAVESSAASLADVVLELRVEIGRTELPLGEVLQLRRGSVVLLDAAADQPVRIYANEQWIACGELVASAGTMAVRITAIVTPDAAAVPGRGMKTT